MPAAQVTCPALADRGRAALQGPILDRDRATLAWALRDPRAGGLAPEAAPTDLAMALYGVARGDAKLPRSTTDERDGRWGEECVGRRCQQCGVLSAMNGLGAVTAARLVTWKDLWTLRAVPDHALVGAAVTAARLVHNAATKYEQATLAYLAWYADRQSIIRFERLARAGCT